jgi:predicted permease
MIKSYLLIALRNFRRNKTFSVINLLGLALGLTCSLLIFLWVRDEVSVDRYHTNGPHLYRLMERQLYDGKRTAQYEVPGVIALEMPKKFPEIVHASGFTWPTMLAFRVGDKVNKESGRWAGSDWFRMFSIPLLAGSAESALKTPNSVAISSKIADNYFGSAQAAIGKTIRIQNKQEYLVTAVFENLPPNTSEKYDFLLPWEDFLNRNAWAREWSNNGPSALLQLRSDADVAAFEQKIKYFMRGYSSEIDIKNLQRFDIELFLQPFEEGYLYSETENGEIAGGRIEYVRLFSVVAVFLLLIACINFMNLATARSAKRAKEVGVRKVVGANRSQLIGQFMAEAFLMTLMAVVVTLLLIALLLPAFNQLTEKNIALPFAEPTFLLALAGIIFTTSLLSGSYPALFLSSLEPIRVLKGGSVMGRLFFRTSDKRFRQGLVVAQFVISMLLIVGTLVVYRQVEFIRTQNLGFDRENLIYVPLEGELPAAYATLKQRLQQMPGIAALSRMGNQPTQLENTTGGVTWPGKDLNASIEFTQVAVGYDMVRSLNLTLVKGRDFSRNFPTDSANYLINEQAAQRMGYQDPVGQPLTLWGTPGRIIGLVKDFHFQSLHEPIQPLIMHLGENFNSGYLLVRTQPGQTQQALASLETLSKKLNPAFPFTYSFADEEYQRMYQSEQVVGTLTTYFAGLAIFIACLGLFGLAAFTAEQSTKEIGIRKVLGASVAGIARLLSRDFLWLVLLAIAIASPLAWWAMNRWLQNYEYRISIDWWLFALAGLMVLVIALLTVSFQAIEAAMANPVKSLRTE